MLTRVRVAGFKAIPPSGVDLELRPLTLLVGPNGSGKSSVLQAIGVLAQSAREQSRRGLVANGVLVRVDPLDESILVPSALLHKRDAKHPLSIEIEAELPIGTVGYRATFEAEPRGEAAVRQEVILGNETLALQRPVHGGAARYTLKKPNTLPEEGDVHGSVDTVLQRGLFRNLTRSGSDIARFGLAADALEDWLSSPMLRYIGGWRGTTIVPRAAPKGPSDVAGAFGENVLRILLTSGTRSERMRAVVADAANFGMPDLEAGLSRQGDLEARYRDPFNEVILPIEAAGEASQRALPLLVELHHADRGSTVLVDELEGGVHPGWMRAWGQTLARAADGGVQVIVTTQSPDLATAVALAVKRGTVKAEDVVVYDFDRSANGLATTRYEIRADGRFDPGFIASYAEAERKLLGGILAWDGEEQDEAPAPKPKRAAKPKRHRAARRGRT